MMLVEWMINQAFTRQLEEIKQTLEILLTIQETSLSAPVDGADDFETTCWGCGLRVVVASYASVFKCGWCGAITRQNVVKNDTRKYLKWRRIRDQCFVCIVILFMLFFICGGIWAVYPIVFSVGYLCGVLHLALASILSVSTLSSFCLSAFRPAGSPPLILWGSYPTVHKGGLENHTFCHHCSKPKSPRTHHCSSCGTCVLDMDHHCPFIGNCVGSANHRSFIFFLISTVISTIYIAITTLYSVLRIWPPLDQRSSHITLSYGLESSIFTLSKQYFLSFLRAAVFLPARGLVLIYLFIASVSVGIGLVVLLWQQLWYIYSGKTYLSHLSSGNNKGDDVERDCHNLVRFFGLRLSAASFLPSYRKSSRKRHDK